MLEARVAGRTGDASDATVEVLRDQIGRLQQPVAWTHVDAAGDLGAAARRLRAAVASSDGAR